MKEESGESLVASLSSPLKAFSSFVWGMRGAAANVEEQESILEETVRETRYVPREVQVEKLRKSMLGEKGCKRCHGDVVRL